jgi:hypothetical protein
VGGVAELAPQLGLPFHIAIKIPATLADLAIVALLFEYGRARRGWVIGTLIPPALYALNPIPALVSSAHGQFDSLPVFFMLLALHLRDRDHKRSLELAALSLGVAIALKAYPAFLLPALALTAPAGRKVWTFGLGLLPLSIAAAIYSAVAGFNSGMLTRVIGYTSTDAMGWTRLAREVSLPLEVLAFAWLFSNLLIVIFATLVPWLVLGKRAVAGAAAIFAFFYTVVFRASVQYVLWGLPFFCLVSTAGTVIFSLAATSMLLAYYATYDPLALPANLPASVIGALQAGYQIRAAFVIAAGAVMLAITLLKDRDRPEQSPPASTHP